MKREVPAGYRVKYKHIRHTATIPRLRLDDEQKLLVSPKGGETVATVLDSEERVVAQGVAVCRPDEQFNKRLGRTVALGRALHSLEQREPSQHEGFARRILDNERTFE